MATGAPPAPSQTGSKPPAEAVALAARVVDAEELPRVEFTDELRAAIVESVQAGTWRTQAAVAQGVPLRDFEEWLLLCQEGRQPYARLLQELRQAEGACEDNYIKTVANKAAGEAAEV